LKARGSRVAALVGDLETDNDARRLAASGAPGARSIRMDLPPGREMIGKHLDGWEGVALGALDYLFIENVGNLVCPSSYDLGEKIRVVLLSVTEGEDKPLKYPHDVQLRRRRGHHQMDIAERAASTVRRLRNITRSGPHPHLRDPPPRPAREEEWLEYLAQERAGRAERSILCDLNHPNAPQTRIIERLCV